MDNLADYGYGLFYDNVDWIVKQNFDDVYELADIIFTDAQINGSLTFNKYKAQKELTDTHTLSEIFYLLSDWGITMEYAAKNIYWETLHVYFAKQDFINSLELKIKAASDGLEQLTEREKVLTVITKFLNLRLDDLPISTVG